jgi:hypothetical protein
MVALCRDHHPEADAGAFTAEQLRAFKTGGRDRAERLSGRFNWLRSEMLAVVGGNFYFETPIAVQLRDQPVIWFHRDDDGRLLLNARMLTTAHQPRLVIEDNDWLTEGTDEADVECPPSGKLVAAKYPNGDELRVEFRVAESAEAFDRRYPSAPRPPAPDWLPADFASRDPEPHSRTLAEVGAAYPLTIVEITMRVGGTPIAFGPRSTAIGGGTMVDCWSIRGHVGLQLG